MRPAIRYTVAMPRPENHLFEVTLELADPPSDPVDLVMPVWTPGSYKVRDYARNVQDFEAPGHAWEKTAKHRWRIRARDRGPLRVRYRVYAFEQNVRGLHLDDEHAYFNGAALLFYVDGAKHLPIELALRPRPGWRVVTALEPAGRSRFVAPDYDTLVDSPVECGRFELHRWSQFGVEHRFAIHGRANKPAAEIVADVKRIVAAEAGLFGGVPYPHYTFLLHTTSPERGGLEHRNSTSLQVAPASFRPRDRYEQQFLGLVSHEFFHLWNVKRIRPEALGPFDYEREVYTRLLWVMEGFTSYYEILALRWARLVPAKRTLGRFAERLQQFLEKPGRRHQTLSESSFDAWIKYYNPTEHTPNSQASYYEKGALIGLCLDLEIRHRTRGAKSLDTVLRALWDRYGRRDVGFPEEAFRKIAEETAGAELADFWSRYVDGTDEIPFGRFLGHAGCRLVKEPRKEDDRPLPPHKTWLGVVGQRLGDRVQVSTVRSDSPAERAGICARDEIIAVDGVRVDAETIDKRIEERRPGDRVRVALLRGPGLREVETVLGRCENVTYAVKPVEHPSAVQRRIYEGWMRDRWPRPERKS